MRASRCLGIDSIDDLWGERPPGNPLNTLQTKVSQLRRVLEQAQPGSGKLVVHRRGSYLMPVDLDVTQFRALVARARDSDDVRTRSRLLADALALWRGPACDESPMNGSRRRSSPDRRRTAGRAGGLGRGQARAR